LLRGSGLVVAVAVALQEAEELLCALDEVVVGEDCESGVNRSTRDVDLYAELSAANRAALEQALGQRGFDVPAMEAELEKFGVFRSRSPEGVFVDIFSAVGPLGEAILDRRKSVAVPPPSLLGCRGGAG
jgi:hypothetical protein